MLSDVPYPSLYWRMKDDGDRLIIFLMGLVVNVSPSEVCCSWMANWKSSLIRLFVFPGGAARSRPRLIPLWREVEVTDSNGCSVSLIEKSAMIVLFSILSFEFPLVLKILNCSRPSISLSFLVFN